MKNKVYTKQQKRCRRSNTGMMKRYGIAAGRGGASSKAVLMPSRFYKNSQQFKKKR